MRKIGVLVLLLIVSIFLVSAADTPDAGIGAGDVEKIKGAIEDYSPLDESGELDIGKYKPFESKAEQRITEINRYVGPITKVLFGVELSLSWVFIFALIMWILLIEIIVMPVSEVFDWNIWWSLGGAGIVAISERTRVISAYEMMPVVPMTAPVMRFSLRTPVEPVMIIPREARATEAVIASKNPIITMLYQRKQNK